MLKSIENDYLYIHVSMVSKSKYQRYLSAKIRKFTKRRSGSILHLYGAANETGIKTEHDCCVLQSGGLPEQLESPYCRAERSMIHTPRISQELRLQVKAD